MRVDSVLFFWLGSLDSRVAAGSPTVGGTHDIRFCARGNLVRRFTGSGPDDNGLWHIALEPYPEAGVGRYDLVIAEYGGARQGECALPAQFGGGGNEYPLWQRVVRPYARARTRPREAVFLLRDMSGRFHARVIRREHVAGFPEPVRRELKDYDPCGRLVRVRGTLELTDLPFRDMRDDVPPFILDPPPADEDAAVDAILALPGSTGTKSAGVRRRRSRILAEKLKRLYSFRCQLCPDDAQRIDMGAGRRYVEVHHIEGFAELDNASRVVAPTQEGAELLIDRAANIVVVCPHHHALLHHDVRRFAFDAGRLAFVGEDGTELALTLNRHLGR